MPAREDGPAIFNSGGTWREGQSAGRYTGTVTVTNGSRLLGNIAVVLYVRGFTLPSTSSLPTAFGVSIDHVCLAHGDASGPWCANGNPDFHLWSRLYGRFLLDHRVTLLLTDVPNPSDWTATQNRYAADYGGLIDGTDPGQRLSGAKMTTVVYPWFNGSDTASAAVSRMSQWVSFTKNRGWFSRTYHYARPDEPGPNCANWSPIIDQGTWAHGVDPDFRVMVTGNMADYNECNAGSAVNWPNFMVDATGVQNRAERGCTSSTALPGCCTGTSPTSCPTRGATTASTTSPARAMERWCTRARLPR